MRIAATEDVVQKGDATGVHLPSPSYYPIVLAFGMPWITWGLIYNLWFCAFGAIFVIWGIYGWVMEPSTDPFDGHSHDDDHADHDPGGDEAPEPAAADEPSGETAPTEEVALVE